MERNRVRSSDITDVATTGTVAVRDAQVLCFTAVLCSSLKLQGSSDGGSTYSDIAGSLLTGDAAVGHRLAIDLFRCKFDHVKVIMVGANATCVIERRGIPTVPPMGVSTTRNAYIVNPQLGTA